MAGSTTNPAARSAGFSLLELLVMMAVLAVVFQAMIQTLLSSSRAFTALAARAHLAARTQVAMDRLCAEMITGRFITLSPANPDGSDSIRFEKVVGFDTDPIAGNPMQIDLVPMESRATDGIDNNGNGLTDECGVRIWEDVAPSSLSAPGSEDPETLVLTNVVPGGLDFTRVGGMLVIAIECQTETEPGSPAQTLTLSSSVRMRND